LRLPQPPFIKICCIASSKEATQAISAGASAIGLVSSMPSGPGVIDDQLISEIAATIPPPLATFLLTSLQHADAIIDQHQLCRTSTIQLVDSLDQAELHKLRTQLPGIKLVQVIHINGAESIEKAQSVSHLVDALLLDSGNQNLDVKELGGTGRTHEWQLSRRINDEVDLPVILAGGLKATNVADARRIVQPFGVDICSGVRLEGKLDVAKLYNFIEAVWDTSCRI